MLSGVWREVGKVSRVTVCLEAEGKGVTCNGFWVLGHKGKVSHVTCKQKHSKAMQSEANQSNAKYGKAKQCKAKPSIAKQSEA